MKADKECMLFYFEGHKAADILMLARKIYSPQSDSENHAKVA